MCCIQRCSPLPPAPFRWRSRRPLKLSPPSSSSQKPLLARTPLASRTLAVFFFQPSNRTISRICDVKIFLKKVKPKHQQMAHGRKFIDLINVRTTCCGRVVFFRSLGERVHHHSKALAVGPAHPEAGSSPPVVPSE